MPSVQTVRSHRKTCVHVPTNSCFMHTLLIRDLEPSRTATSLVVICWRSKTGVNPSGHVQNFCFLCVPCASAPCSTTMVAPHAASLREVRIASSGRFVRRRASSWKLYDSLLFHFILNLFHSEWGIQHNAASRRACEGYVTTS